MSLGAALGVLVLTFQDGNLEGLIDFRSVGAIESMIPFLVLAFGFGLSMDYEVFLSPGSPSSTGRAFPTTGPSRWACSGRGGSSRPPLC